MPTPRPDRAGGTAIPPATAFIVQFPAPSGAGAEASARVEHVASGRSAQFTSTRELLGFFSEILSCEVSTMGQRAPSGILRDMAEEQQAEAMRAAHTREVAVRADVSAALAIQGPLRDMLRGCAEAVVKHLDAAFARIWVIRKGCMLELQASAGMYTHLDGAHSRIPVGQLKIGLIAQEGVPHITNDLTHDPRISDPQWAQAVGMVGFAGYPLLVNGRAIGVLAMFARYAVSPLTTDMLATIADAIAQGIQRKQAEDEVRRSEAFLAEAQALSRTGSWGCNTRTGEMSWTRETYRIFGLETDIAPTFSMVREIVHPDDLHLFEQDAERLPRERVDFDREYRLRSGDAGVKYVHVVGRWVAGAFPDLDFVGSIMDVTERKGAEEALLSARARLEEISRLTTMGELAASIAHEINQPLTTIVTNAQACRGLLHAESPSLEEVHAAVMDIAEAGKRASDVIARIRLLLQKTTLQPARLDVNAIIQEVLTWTRSEISQKRIVVRTDLADDLLPVQGDRLQLQQVLINLIRNAADAMAENDDRPRTLTVTSRMNTGDLVDVTVSDSGVGIEPEHRARVFEPFFSTKPEGMGMGLAICRSIIEAYGGHLTAADSQGFGTTMRFVLPADTYLSAE